MFGDGYILVLVAMVRIRCVVVRIADLKGRESKNECCMWNDGKGSRRVST